MLKTPLQTNYFSDENLLFDAVKNAINNNIFQIPDESSYNSYRMLPSVNDLLKPFGWKIERGWYGLKDDGHSIIKIIAIERK